MPRLVWLWLSMGFVACAVLLVMCLLPSPPQADIPGYDKIGHFMAYLVLAVWFAGVLPHRHWRVFFGLAFFGLAIELIQSMTTYRSGDPWDMLADLAGIVAGIFLARLGAMGWLSYIERRVTGNL